MLPTYSSKNTSTALNTLTIPKGMSIKYPIYTHVSSPSYTITATPSTGIPVEDISWEQLYSFVYTGRAIPKITNVIYNDPATIVFWSDGTKTVVKASKGDKFIPEVGLAMAITKKALGNKGSYYKEFKKWVPSEE